jgi:hypothetical protein
MRGLLQSRRQRASVGPMTASIPLAKRVSDCFKRHRLRRQRYDAALGSYWSRTIFWTGRSPCRVFLS